ncbi:MAG: hypothetical protein RL154_1485 [Pseudomonadota bacterium]
MKTKQKNIRIFEIESLDFDETIAYIQKNAALLNSFPLAFNGVAAKQSCEWAVINGYCAFVAPECLGSIKKPSSANTQTFLAEEPKRNIEQEDIKQIANEQEARVIITKMVRSGEIIQSNSDVVVFGRVNSGAKIITKGSVEVFDEVDGLIECDGDYLILRSIGKGSVVFKNETIKKDILKYDLQRLYFENSQLQIKKI